MKGQIVVIAKEPLPGRVKTRLTPPYTPQAAAALAQAALEDTLHAVAATPAIRRVLCLAGEPGPWLPPGFTVLPQRGDGLDERIAAAFADAHATLACPIVLIGMDTPQVTPLLLGRALHALGSHDAALGPARDGGFWLLGLRRPDQDLVRGVPMSRADTGHVQLLRIRRAGLSVQLLPELTDVDTAADIDEVARQTPGSRFAAALACHAPPTAEGAA
ncbi:TIGR04282 family arsenosugar biosynthesis glycosyltransferase [Planotetraspora sp. A-T 1434]|uniref:TIGR04282 family arsenosugar biosynthesis glycosyltransferase n=1 Tax=Planotetraspora sp. A-T 1434 TaxID=2979219 RepID=UPI0021C03E5C|nr:TIGR04282 family arsenosugar biosynthesis glycosyltransferase [Planotetraspora sp. A-T 1434]MCT9935115.1 TIGR04282 family arsenosugar biosynthesis glycosyltransferase [Planotetraspora sp. A-T 1434]